MNFTAKTHIDEQHSPAFPQSLAPQSWPFDLKWLPETAYLVGGSVRDGLLDRHSAHLDLDFVLPNQAVETARAIARHYHSGFVVLDAEHQIARVVFDDVTVDFAQQVGASLDDDLHRRDFTINAIAYHPHTQTIVDPLQGQQDLQRQMIRMISRKNLEEDPLRLLRAYRQAAQLGFGLDAETETAIGELSDLLKKVASERVYSELSYLLSYPSGTAKLSRILDKHLLSYWLPDATDQSIQHIHAIDDAVQAVVGIWPEMKQILAQWPRDQQHATGGGRSWLKVAKLSCLVRHQVEAAEAELRRLKCSRLEIQSVIAILRQRPLIMSGAIAHLSRREQFFMFKDVGDVFPAVVVVAIALGVPLDGVAPLIDKYLNPDDPVAHPTPLVTGRDLMAHLHISPGPQVGQLLAQIQIAQAEGRIQNREDALHFAEHLVSN